MGIDRHQGAGWHVAPTRRDVVPRRFCHDRRVAARALKLSPRHRTPDGARRHRITLFRRLFLAYALVLGVAVAVLVLAPITVSVPTALRELAVILAGFVAMLFAYRMLLQRALAPLERLTSLMQRVDPLTPGQRLEMTDADKESHLILKHRLINYCKVATLIQHPVSLLHLI